MSELAGPIRSRNAVVDACKGFAILLVVLGHVLQSHLSQPDDNWLYRIIYSFHMPLFFLLSGWVAKPESKGRIKKTFLRLIPPTFSWYAIQYVAEQRYKNEGFLLYLVKFLQRPDNGLWFLWVLAFCILALVLCRRLEERAGIWAYLIGVIVLMTLPIHYLGVSLMGVYFPYLTVGYLLSRSSMDVKRAAPYVIGISAIIYPLALPFWHRTLPLSSGKSISWLAGHLTVQVFEFAGAKFVEGFTGSVIAICIVFLIYRYLHLSLLLWFGQRTLEIYVSHQLFVYLFPSSSPVAIAEAFIAALSAPIILALLLKRIRLLDFLLYGGELKRPAPLAASAA